MSNGFAANRVTRYGVVLLALVLLGGLLLAFNDALGKEKDGFDRPTGAREVVLRVEMRGGFMMPFADANRYPIFTLYGDGCYIVEGPMIEIYPAPALPNLQQGCLTDEGVEKILQAAKDAGLMDGNIDDAPNVIADAAAIAFIVNANGTTYVTQVYAFGDEISESDLTADQIARRNRLQAFVESLPGAGNLIGADDIEREEQAYDYDRMKIVVIPGAPYVSEGLEAQEIAWPLAGDLAEFGESYSTFDGVRCGVVEGADLGALKAALQTANMETIWTSGDAEYTIIAAPLLPDAVGCE